MKSVNLKKIIPFALFLFAVASLSSCNRGLGCPSDFSVGKTAIQVAKTLPAAAAVIKK